VFGLFGRLAVMRWDGSVHVPVILSERGVLSAYEEAEISRHHPVLYTRWTGVAAGHSG